MTIAPLCRIFLLLLLFCAHPCLAQQVDSVVNDTTSSIHDFPPGQHADDDEFNLFLAVFGMIAVSVMAGVAILTVFILGGALTCVGALIAVGALSVSVGVAIYRRSYTSGIKTALFICSAFIGTISGTLIAWMARKVFQLQIANSSAIITGATAGLIGGCIAAACIIWLVRKLFKTFEVATKP